MTNRTLYIILPICTLGIQLYHYTCYLQALILNVQGLPDSKIDWQIL